jgi:hypothetical protein
LLLKFQHLVVSGLVVVDGVDVVRCVCVWGGKQRQPSSTDYGEGGTKCESNTTHLRPVINEFLLGAQTAICTYARKNVTPPAASRSMEGVEVIFMS